MIPFTFADLPSSGWFVCHPQLVLERIEDSMPMPMNDDWWSTRGTKKKDRWDILISWFGASQTTTGLNHWNMSVSGLHSYGSEPSWGNYIFSCLQLPYVIWQGTCSTITWTCCNGIENQILKVYSVPWSRCLTISKFDKLDLRFSLCRLVINNIDQTGLPQSP